MTSPELYEVFSDVEALEERRRSHFAREMHREAHPIAGELHRLGESFADPLMVDFILIVNSLVVDVRLINGERFKTRATAGEVRDFVEVRRRLLRDGGVR